jgi:cytochrome b pre-mRNA-processing protein 3
MIALHVILFSRRACGGSDVLGSLAQAVFDAFCRDMDHNLREMGVSDVGIPRKMRSLGGAYYGRAAVYDQALDAAGDEMLGAALARNVFGREETGNGVRRLAAYVREAVCRLHAQEEQAMSAGLVDFPDPDTISLAEENDHDIVRDDLERSGPGRRHS